MKLLELVNLEQQFGFVKNSAADLATVPKGLAGITKAHSAVTANACGSLFH